MTTILTVLAAPGIIVGILFTLLTGTVMYLTRSRGEIPNRQEFQVYTAYTIIGAAIVVVSTLLLVLAQLGDGQS